MGIYMNLICRNILFLSGWVVFVCFEHGLELRLAEEWNDSAHGGWDGFPRKSDKLLPELLRMHLKSILLDDDFDLDSFKKEIKIYKMGHDDGDEGEI